jgi:hypothetical protein
LINLLSLTTLLEVLLNLQLACYMAWYKSSPIVFWDSPLTTSVADGTWGNRRSGYLDECRRRWLRGQNVGEDDQRPGCCAGSSVVRWGSRV